MRTRESADAVIRVYDAVLVTLNQFRDEKSRMARAQCGY